MATSGAAAGKAHAATTPRRPSTASTADAARAPQNSIKNNPNEKEKPESSQPPSKVRSKSSCSATE